MNTHPLYSIGIENSAAKLVLTPCPGTQTSSLKATLQEFHQRGIGAVITLITTSELESLALTELGPAIKSMGMNWFHLPIEDESCPDNHFINAWQSAGPAIHRLLEKQKSVVIHCNGGSERTEVIAAQLLLERGEPLKQVLKQIKKLRPDAFKRSQHQHYLHNLEQDLVLA